MEESDQPAKVPSAYELKAIESFRTVYKPTKKKGLGKVLANLGNPLHRATDWVAKIPGADKILENTQQKILHLFHDFSHWTVDLEEVKTKYLEAGHHQVQTPEDIAHLDLEDVENVIGDLCKKYKVLAGEQEPEESSVSLPGMPTDIVALISLNHKAISEYAAHYGFDIQQYHERIFALNILEYAASTDKDTKQVVLERLIKNAKEMVGQKSTQHFDKKTFFKLFTTLTGAISIRLLKAKIGQVIPIKGAVIGTGFNAYFTYEVCDIAHTLYQQRFLAEKYGEEIIDLEVEEEKTNED